MILAEDSSRAGAQDFNPSSLYTQIFRATAMYSLATIAGTAASVIMLPVYARFLHPADYGALELLDATRSIFSIIIGARFTEALLYFSGRAKSPQERQSSISTVIWGSLLLGSLGFALGYLCSPYLASWIFHNRAMAFELRLMFLTFGLSLPVEASLAHSRAIDARKRFVWISFARLALIVGVSAVGVIILRLQVAGVLLGALISNLILAVYVIAHFAVTSPLQFKGRLFISQLRFGFLLTLTGSAAFILNFGDRFFLSRYVSLPQVGLYGLAYKAGMVVSIAQAAFGQYWGGQVYSVVEGDAGLYRFRRVHTYLILSLCYLAVVISSSVGLIFGIILPEEYTVAAKYVPWIALIYVLRAHADYFRSGLYVEGIPIADSWSSLLSAGICVSLYAIFIPVFGIWGAIIATAVGFLALSILVWIALARKRAYGIERYRVSMTAAIAIISSVLLGTIHSQSRYIQFASMIGGSLGFPVLLYCSGIFSMAERAAVRQCIRRVLLELKSSVGAFGQL